MTRSLTDEENSIHKLFSSAVLLKENNEYTNISFAIKKQKLMVTNPVVYDVEGTDSILILGEPRQQKIDMELLKRFYEKQMKAKLDEPSEKCVKSDDSRISEDDTNLGMAVNECDVSVKEEDINLIKSQINVDRSEIISALVESGNDVVKAMSRLSK